MSRGQSPTGKQPNQKKQSSPTRGQSPAAAGNQKGAAQKDLQRGSRSKSPTPSASKLPNIGKNRP